ncbi:MAG: hypothetical protein RL071_1177 [Pseudomonadota bacterium]
MRNDALLDRSPLRALSTQTRGALDPGQVGVIFGGPGVGKSALLVQIGLSHALRGVPVLHLCLHDPAARVRSAYDELFAELSRASRPAERGGSSVELERHRLISARPAGLDPDGLDALLQSLAEALDHRPAVVLIDDLPRGVDPAPWRALAARRGLRLWAAVVADPAEAAAAAPAWDTAATLEADAEAATLRPLREAGAPSTGAPIHLDPVTLLVAGAPAAAPVLPPPSPPPSGCTLYSGGATGAEAAFGEVAEQHGVREVNFSFDGHNQARSAGRQVLSARALSAGDVSLVYVAHRLHRHWDQTETLRRVLQCQWHMVSHADQLFVVGSIQPDGTVHGGTGWSVELARRWHKRVWVFDQNHEAWFCWTGATWSRGEPVIESPAIAATGTRFLNEAGRRAISALFEASFGPRPAR